MGFFQKITNKETCAICNKEDLSWLLFDITDGKICRDCFNKIGTGKYSKTLTLKSAKEKIRYNSLTPYQKIMERFKKYDLDDFHKETIKNAIKLKTDLVEADYPEPASALEAKYRGRIFSLTGDNSDFPLLPVEIFETRISFYPFVYGASEPLYCPPGKEKQYSNRPFIDNRKKKEKEEYEIMAAEIIRKAKNEADFKWLQENLPELVPKSLSAYSRMKNSNSKNFQKLQQAASELNHSI